MDEVINFLTSEMKKEGMGGYGNGDTGVKQDKMGMIAKAFSRCISGRYIRYNESGIYLYDEGFYRPIDGEIFEAIVGAVMDNLEMGIAYVSFAQRNIHGIIMKNMTFLKNNKFEPSKGIISFTNCILDLDKMDTHEHSDKFQTRLRLDFDYNPKAVAKRWLQFLTEVIFDSPSISILQEFLGCMFIDKKVLRPTAALFMIGEGSNGKSVLHSTLKGILGENMSVASFTQLCSDQNKGYFCHNVNGKLLNYCSDMPPKDFSTDGDYKAITDGEDIMVRQIREKPYIATEMPMLAANLNNFPIVTDSSDGFWRRMRLINFEAKFTDETKDESLPSKLEREFSGIFNWIMEGRMRFIRNRGRFTTSEKMQQMISAARIDADSGNSFIAVEGYVGDLKDSQKGELIRMHSKDLYLKYKEYCFTSMRSPKSINTFKKSAERAGLTYYKSMRINGEISSGWSFYKVEVEPDEIFDVDKELGINKTNEEIQMDFPF